MAKKSTSKKTKTNKRKPLFSKIGTAFANVLLRDDPVPTGKADPERERLQRELDAIENNKTLEIEDVKEYHEPVIEEVKVIEKPIKKKITKTKKTDNYEKEKKPIEQKIEEQSTDSRNENCVKDTKFETKSNKNKKQIIEEPIVDKPIVEEVIEEPIVEEVIEIPIVEEVIIEEVIEIPLFNDIQIKPITKVDIVEPILYTQTNIKNKTDISDKINKQTNRFSIIQRKFVNMARSNSFVMYYKNVVIYDTDTCRFNYKFYATFAKIGDIEYKYDFLKIELK